MHQVVMQYEGIVCECYFQCNFSLTSLFLKVTCNKDLIGVIRKTSINDFTKCMNTPPSASKHIEEYHEPVKRKNINKFKLDDDKCFFITGEPGTGKTYMCKQLQQVILNKW